VKNKKNIRRSPKRQRCNTKKKRRYRTRNWSEYNASLVRRGSLTLWIDKSVEDGWVNEELSGRRGASKTYSDNAIEMTLMLKVVYGLPLRATQGLLASLLKLMQLEHLPVPDYTTLCRRQQTLEVAVSRGAAGEAIHVVVDSTGCKIFGEGEWKVRQHGYSKRRTWRKLHVAVNEATGEIVGAVVSSNDVADSAALPELLEQVEGPISQISADGTYDKRRCYDTIRQRQGEQEEPITISIPPQKNARIWQHGNTKQERLARDQNLRRIRQVGRQQWKEEIGYHRRSLVETAMFRLKTIFGNKLSARTFDSQATEAFIRCVALNKMTALGMPESYAV
jgi:IS5 family transposase